MCDYGEIRERNLKPKDIKEILYTVLNKLDELPQVLLLNSLGSVLDTSEMPEENIVTLLDELAKIDIKVVIFETHYLTINNKVLSLIKQKLPNKDIGIELGLESSNPKIRQKCLNKNINNLYFIEKVKLIKKYGFEADSNVIFGAPFLTTAEQIKDTINSIKWCFRNKIDEVILFPINIKPYTLLYKLYEQGMYLPVKHMDFIKMLKLIPKEYIDKIHISWYGNRELNYGKKKTIFPQCKDEEYNKIMEFYRQFNMNKNALYRMKLLKDISKK